MSTNRTLSRGRTTIDRMSNSHQSDNHIQNTREGSAAAVVRKAARRGFMATLRSEGVLVNLSGNYNYLESPYYRSQDVENSGVEVHPTCKEMLDAYVTPVFLEKAKLAELPIPEYYITNSYFEPPVVVDPINPFMTKSRIVLKANRRESVARSMTRNFTYAMCCQDIPPGAKVVYFRAVLGWCAARKYRAAAESIWRVFRIPIARVRVLELADKSFLFSDISPLPFEKLHKREVDHIGKLVIWDE